MTKDFIYIFNEELAKKLLTENFRLVSFNDSSEPRQWVFAQKGDFAKAVFSQFSLGSDFLFSSRLSF